MTELQQDNRARLAAMDVKMEWMESEARKRFERITTQVKETNHAVDVLRITIEKQIRVLTERQEHAHPWRIAKRLFFSLSKVILLVVGVVGGLIPFVKWVWERMQ